MGQTVSDIMTKAPVALSVEDTVRDAARHMRELNVGAIVVQKHGQLFGIVTDRDIVVHALACGLDLDVITVADLATRLPVSVPADADLTEITATMCQHGVRRVLVTRGSELAGIISMDKVIMATAGLLNNLSDMLGRQYEYEQAHLEIDASEPRAAAR